MFRQFIDIIRTYWAINRNLSRIYVYKCIFVSDEYKNIQTYTCTYVSYYNNKIIF